MVTVKRNPRIMKNFQEFQESTRLKRETGTLVKGGTKYQPKSKNEVVKKVIDSIYASGGKIMRKGSNQQKKVRGGPTGGGGKYLEMQNQKKQLKADAKEMGYGSDTKGYVETRARYGSKENMKSGKGLGT
tara:strand:+ start:239 stop:628 length:390 start_codon:yes stop_codon:yes gene_type:complete